MPPIQDHPLRLSLANELHARPFPAVAVPYRAVHLALMPKGGRADRDRTAEWRHLCALLERHGAPPPPEGANHHFGDIGRCRLKWESHSEFQTFTAFLPGLGDKPFDPTDAGVFPDDWLDAAPGVRMTSAMVRVLPGPAEDAMLEDWFVPESLAVSHVVDGGATVAGDFRLDAAGHMRLALFVGENMGQRRVGRVLQRLLEVETYKTMAMLGLVTARETVARLAPLEDELGAVVHADRKSALPPAAALERILDVAGALEDMATETTYRFAATRAYATLVSNRIEVLREERFEGRQTFAEFMARRFQPSMRTVEAAERQLASVGKRSMRAADLLRTQVDVARSAQNQELLASMDRRADLQLRLQQTVEGLSVVAISYYALNLASYALAPFAHALEIDKTTLSAGLVPPIVLAVWWLVRRIRRHHMK